MINEHILKKTMELEENKQLFKQMQTKTNEQLSYKEFVFGTIVGGILVSILKMNLNENLKKEKISALVEQFEKDGINLEIKETISFYMGVETIIISIYDFDIEDFKNLTKTKETKELPEGYEKFKEEINVKVKELANTVYKEEILDGEIEHMEISLMVIAHLIAGTLNNNIEHRAMAEFEFSKHFLKNEYDIELSLIGKGLASMINKKTKSIKVYYDNGAFKLKREETNNQKITRSMSKLLDLQNRI